MPGGFHRGRATDWWLPATDKSNSLYGSPMNQHRAQRDMTRRMFQFTVPPLARKPHGSKSSLAWPYITIKYRYTPQGVSKHTEILAYLQILIPLWFICYLSLQQHNNCFRYIACKCQPKWDRYSASPAGFTVAPLRAAVQPPHQTQPRAFQRGKHIPAIIVCIGRHVFYNALLIAVETKATGDQFQGSSNNVSWQVQMCFHLTPSHLPPSNPKITQISSVPGN